MKPAFSPSMLSAILTISATKTIDTVLSFLFTKPISNYKLLLQFHSVIVTSGHSNNIYVAAKLISVYSFFQKSHISEQVFHSAGQKDAFLWNSVIKAYYYTREFDRSLQLYSQMQTSGCPFSYFTFPMVASICAEQGALNYGKKVHCSVLKSNFILHNSAIGSSLMYMYVKCGALHDAFKMFEEMHARDVVAWTTLIVGCVRNNEPEKGLDCIREMHRSVCPNFRTIQSGLQACGNSRYLITGKCLHGFGMKTGTGCSSIVQSSLLSMYSRCDAFEESLVSFLELPDKDIISWTEVIGVYARGGYLVRCFQLFQAMNASGICPDGIVIACLVTGIVNFASVCEGKAFHGMIVKQNFELDNTTVNSLLMMYNKFEHVDIAYKLFQKIPQTDFESWNLMIWGLNKKGMESRCLDLFREMQFLSLETDSKSLVTVISSCSRLLAIKLGRSAHAFAIKYAYTDVVSVSNSLVDMYGRCGKSCISWNIFCRMNKDVISWNTLISVYSNSESYSDALAVFEEMVLQDIKPNAATFAIVLSICSNLTDLDKGKRVHNHIKEMGLEFEISVGTSLIDMYAKCGQLGISRQIFESMPKRDVITWNVMISSYGIHGNGNDAIRVFEEMEENGIKPNEITFLVVLAACSHAGMVEEGKDLFSKMEKYSIRPNSKHYATMVDLLGRTGKLDEAKELISLMPVCPDGGVWGSLLNSCRIHGNVEMGEEAAKQAFETSPENDGYYILMSNVYSSFQKWKEAEKVRGMMRKRQVKKAAGWSVIKINEGSL